jgi:ketosteroid isomerase-like protein
MKLLKWFAVAGFAVFIGWQAWQRLFVTDATRVKRLIGAMETAVEQNKIVALADCIAGDYSDDRGLDKATLLGAVRSVRMQFEALFIHIGDMVIEVAPDARTAQATLVAKVLTRRAGGGETELNAERVRLFFRKTDAGWKLIRLESPELRFD